MPVQGQTAEALALRKASLRASFPEMKYTTIRPAKKGCIF